MDHRACDGDSRLNSCRMIPMSMALHDEFKSPHSAKTVDAKRGVVVFELNGQGYGIPVETVEEILPMARLSRPPQAPSLLAGFLNIEGQLLPVIRLRRLFGLDDRPTEIYTPLVVLRLAHRRLAFVVDRVHQMASIRESDTVPIESMYSLNRCATGMFEVAGRAVVLLSPERLLLEQESAHIDELTNLERNRLCQLAEAVP